jgi:hypothetical protein
VPIEEVAMPFPTPDITPPKTNMYLWWALLSFRVRADLVFRVFPAGGRFMEAIVDEVADDCLLVFIGK